MFCCVVFFYGFSKFSIYFWITFHIVMNTDTLLLVGVGTVTVILLAEAARRLKSKRRARRSWNIRPINRDRQERSQFFYFKKMKAKDPDQFFKYTRMSVASFNHLLTQTEQKIRRRKIALGISPEERLAITLQYLSQGGSMQHLAWDFQIGLTTVSQIIYETCTAICEALIPIYLKEPTKNDFKDIAKDFFEKWNFPNCIGSLDGKHINIQAPANTGSQFFNYKKSFSIVLLAVADADYLFRLVDIGAYGSQSDGGILKESAFGKKLEQGTMNIPLPSPIPNTNIEMPFVLVGDQAFPLKHYLFRPYAGTTASLSKAQRIFNYRLSRCRRVIENAFGILVTRWRLFKDTIIAKPEKVDLLVKTCVVLHNFCMMKKYANPNYCPQGFVDTSDEDNGQWRAESESLSSIRRVGSNNATRFLFNLRDRVAEYFMGEGQVPWQELRVNMGMEIIFPRTF